MCFSFGCCSSCLPPQSTFVVWSPLPVDGKLPSVIQNRSTNPIERGRTIQSKHHSAHQWPPDDMLFVRMLQLTDGSPTAWLADWLTDVSYREEEVLQEGIFPVAVSRPLNAHCWTKKQFANKLNSSIIDEMGFHLNPFWAVDCFEVRDQTECVAICLQYEAKSHKSFTGLIKIHSVVRSGGGSRTASSVLSTDDPNWVTRIQFSELLGRGLVWKPSLKSDSFFSRRLWAHENYGDNLFWNGIWVMFNTWFNCCMQNIHYYTTNEI